MDFYSFKNGNKSFKMPINTVFMSLNQPKEMLFSNKYLNKRIF